MSDDFLSLQEPFVTPADIRQINFFNGRLLTGRDFTIEQDARHSVDARLGLSLGDGVVFGLDVLAEPRASPSNLPFVTVAPGLAINRNGRTLRLQERVSIALARRFESVSADRLFTRCANVVGGTYVAGSGIYVLTVAPAQLANGRAQNNGLDSANVRCATDATIEGVQFRLLYVRPAAYAGLDASAATFRNELAYRCFGTGVQATWFDDLQGVTARDEGLLEGLRRTSDLRLTDDDVPLALIHLAGAGALQFVDVWSVCRPLSPLADQPLTSLTQSRRAALGQAMFLQFQRQIDSLITPGSGLGTVTARSHFRYLPPAGLIRVQEGAERSDGELLRFFAGMTVRGPVFMNAARLEGLIRESLCAPPIDTRRGELVWLYRVRENRQAIENPQGRPIPPASYLVFASGHLPYRGNAQFDLTYFDYSNFAPIGT